MKIGFIGIGNMGGAIIKGYRPYAETRGDDLYGYARTKSRLLSFCRENKIQPCDTVEELVETCQMVVLAIKPKDFPEILEKIAPMITKDKVIVSIAAGITIKAMEEALGRDAVIIRTMPNTPAMVGEGMTSVSGNTNVSEEVLQKVLSIFRSIGRAEEVPEDMIHCVVGASGSSPAYTYMYIDALAKTAEKNGMDYNQALVLVAQSVLGAAKMVLESGESPEKLRIAVCSPGGATIDAVNALFDNGFMDNVAEGFQAAYEKSKVMSK